MQRLGGDFPGEVVEAGGFVMRRSWGRGRDAELPAVVVREEAVGVTRCRDEPADPVRLRDASVGFVMPRAGFDYDSITAFEGESVRVANETHLAFEANGEFEVLMMCRWDERRMLAVRLNQAGRAEDVDSRPSAADRLDDIGKHVTVFYKQLPVLSICRGQVAWYTRGMNSDKLAVFGGTPVFSKAVRASWPTPWPPTNKTTERALVKLYRSQSWSWNGLWERKFAADFGRLHTARYVVPMANGTVTLEAALHVLGVGPGDEVIVPSLTWLATAMAVIYVGAKPVFVDVEPDTLCLDPVQTAAAITARTKAIIPVHLYGGMADMDGILALARKHKLKVIEDCAHAHGGMWNGRGLGSLGDIGSFSFQQSKTVASGEGGCVVTNSDRLLERLFRFKNIGYDLSAKQGKAKSGPPAGLLCHNYRATEFQAVVLHGQLAGLRAMTIRRNRNADFLTRELEKIPGVKIQARGRKATRGRQSYYAFMAILDLAQWGGATNRQVCSALNAEGLPVGPTYGSVYRHSLWNAPKSKYRIHSVKVSDEIGTARCVGFLHWYLDLPQRDLEKFVAAYAKVQRNAALLQRLK